MDEELAADTGTLAGAGDRAITGAVRAAAYRRYPQSIAKRASHAVSERTVSLRPAPDTMAYLTALLPVAQGVAVHAALTRHADALKSSGDERPNGAIMADALIERVTGTPGRDQRRRDPACDDRPHPPPKYGTTPAAPPTATCPSATTTTSPPGTKTAPPPAETDKASAKPATTLKKHQAGQPHPSRGPDTQ